MNSPVIQVIDKKEELRKEIFRLRKNDKTIGFVPTMGYLHTGHLDLVTRAKEITDFVVVSIYVNPSQFSEEEDFSHYPSNIPKDLELLKKYNADLVFIPPGDKMYDENHLTWVSVTGLENKLCGKSRPGHFRGVATIVLKLLNIVTPDLMCMGEKDYQQIIVLEKMLTDLDLPVRIVRCPTVREEDGLAMSSRNSYLSPQARENAASLYQALLMAREMFREGIRDSATVIRSMRDLIENNGGKIDYIEAVDSKTLDSLKTLKKGCRIALAVFFEGARLIDNIEIQ